MRLRLAWLIGAALLYATASGAQNPDSDLLSAAAAGDLEGARKALAQGASLAATRWRDITAFQLACKSGNLELVKLLHEGGANPLLDGVHYVANDAWYGSPLAAAAAEGHLEVVRYLVEGCGLDADKPERPENEGGPPGWTALTWAAQRGRTEVARYLLAKGASVEVRDSSGQTPLHCAAAQGHDEVAHLLLDRRADPGAVDRRGLTPLHGAAGAGRGDLVGRLLAAGADPNRPDRGGDTPLHFAAASGDALGCGVLLSYRGDPRARDLLGQSPLHLAAAAGSEAACTALLVGGAEVDARDAEGETPLFRAARRGVKGPLFLLMDAGADPKARSLGGGTPLHAAAAEGRATACALLLYRGAERDARNDLGQTALHLACLEEEPDVARLLLVLGADARWADDQGWTALHFAAFADSLATAATLLEYGEPELEARTAAGQTPLLVACAAASGEFVLALLDAGSYVGARDKEGVGPLGHTWAGDGGTLALLLQRGARFGEGDFKAKAGPEARDFLDNGAALSQYLAAGLDPDLRAEGGARLLHLACEDGRTEVVQLLLQYGADAASVDDEGATPLHAWASDYRTRPEIPALLLKAGAPVDARDRGGRTPLMACSTYGLGPEKIRCLLDAGADKDLADLHGRTPLHWAASFGCAPCVSALVERNADLKAETTWGASALAMAVANGQEEIASSLREAGASERGVLDAELADAVIMEDAVAVKNLLKAGASPDSRSGFVGVPALTLAAEVEAWDLVELLTDAGASVDSSDARGKTTARAWVELGDVQNLARWITFHPDLNRADINGVTPLYAATMMGDTAMVALLLDHGADPNRSDAKGGAALFASLFSSVPEERPTPMELLLAAGADPNARLLDGTSLIHRLVLVRSREETVTLCLDLLLGAGADLEARDSAGRTALHLAATEGNTDAARALLQAGASPQARDREGLTPAGAALEHLREETFDLLRTWGHRRPPWTPSK